MKQETPHQGELGRGLSGRFDCLDCTLARLFVQVYFSVFPLLLPLLPSIVAVCREVWP